MNTSIVISQVDGFYVSGSRFKSVKDSVFGDSLLEPDLMIVKRTQSNIS